jgi:hypothetical protein
LALRSRTCRKPQAQAQRQRQHNTLCHEVPEVAEVHVAKFT